MKLIEKRRNMELKEMDDKRLAFLQQGTLLTLDSSTYLVNVGGPKTKPTGDYFGVDFAQTYEKFHNDHMIFHLIDCILENGLKTLLSFKKTRTKNRLMFV